MRRKSLAVLKITAQTSPPPVSFGETDQNFFQTFELKRPFAVVRRLFLVVADFRAHVAQIQNAAKNRGAGKAEPPGQSRRVAGRPAADEVVDACEFFEAVEQVIHRFRVLV